MNSPDALAGGDPRLTALKESTRVRERELLRVAGQLTGADSALAAQAARLEVLKWAAQQIGDRLPDVAMQGRSFEHLRGGRTCIGAGFADDYRVLWALRVDRPDANVAQRTWTTEIVIGHAPGETRALFSLRLLVSSPEATLQVEPAVPGLVRLIATTCGLQQNGSPLDATAWHIASEDDAQELVAALINPARTVPYLVCSVAESEAQPGINSQMLAKVALGIARVVVVPAAQTWVLTQQLGKPLSVFNGAARAYMPGFTYDANPYAHRLFFIDPKPSEERARSTLTALRWLAANESIRRLQLGADVLAFSAVREASLDVERERLRQAGSADTEQLRAAQAQIDALKDDLRRSVEIQQWLSDEHTAIEEHAQSLEQQLRGAQFRIQQLLDQIKARGDEPDAGICLPESWDAFADWCDEVLSGRVALSGRARRGTKSASFDDPQAAARCLVWLANEYRDSRLNGAFGDLRRPIAEGIHNERCGADSFDFAWCNRRAPVEWHLKNGGNTRDPRRCLRIYYFWDEESQMVVIATMPAHIRTGAT
ncbi:MAG: hypothetical protein DVS81_17330 [Candidatus Accumulibacter meliphilus]|jgi:hypothetical protein|uniref:Uncharacterized protein n=1 Tax=Candidatus Accumulibacter meliphilus TaxID=2211374 RepID=A0A369XGT0_9PROT|nr:MAG: hypothetical protein DVS81_17330 [Candidatus Accumulibacter meliphilus]